MVNNKNILIYTTNYFGDAMEILTVIITILKVITLSAVFFVWFIRYENIVKEFEYYKYSPKLRDFVGILKITSALLIQSSSAINVKVGSATLALLMLAAFITHLRVKNSPLEFIPSLSLLLFSILIFFNC